MIFVTVGTEHPFDRLVLAIDEICARGECGDAFVQIGSGGEEPEHARFARFLSPQDMQATMRAADLVICHAGPSTIALARACGRKPIVVPRRPELGEHVDEHQILFARRLAASGLVTVVEDLDRLDETIQQVVRRGDASSTPDENDHSARAAERVESLAQDLILRRKWRRVLWDRRTGQ